MLKLVESNKISVLNARPKTQKATQMLVYTRKEIIDFNRIDFRQQYSQFFLGQL